MTTAIIVVSVFLVFAFIYLITKNKKPLKRAFITMLSGVFSLVLVNLLGLYFSINLPISPFSIVVSACTGIPGVASMLIINTLL